VFARDEDPRLGEVDVRPVPKLPRLAVGVNADLDRRIISAFSSPVKGGPDL
jgi:hypothetical protein